jgi:hypothetical protein
MKARAIVAAAVVLGAAVAAEEKLSELPKLESGERGYQEVVLAEGIETSELLSRARAWVAEAYATKAVVQLDDPAGGTYVVKGNFSITYGLMVPAIDHTLTVEVKPGRYRYRLSGFSAYSRTIEQWAHDQAPTDKGRAKIYSRVAEQSERLIASLKAAMLQPSPAKSEW